MSSRAGVHALTAAAATAALIGPTLAAPAATPQGGAGTVREPHAGAPRATAARLVAGPLQAVSRRGRPGTRIPRVEPSPAHGAYVAKVLRPTAMRAAPGRGHRIWEVATTTTHSRGATRLLVLEARRDRRGRPWLRIDAPIRPNARSGWIPARAVRLAHTPWYLTVSTGRRELRAHAGGALRRRARLVVGAPATPTPHGLFAIYELTRQADPLAFVGPWAMHLTALSDVLFDYGGGPGRVALHGRGPASLVDPLGSARSHGCLRADNAVIDWLRARVGPGTPIRIGP